MTTSARKAADGDVVVAKYDLKGRKAVKLHLEPRAMRAGFDETAALLVLDLVDGRTLGFPYRLFPTLADATPEQRAAVSIEADGYALRWEEIDEDIAVPHLLGLPY